MQLKPVLNPCRQDLFGASYGLLKVGTLEPNPSYWVAVLAKRLLGRRTSACMQALQLERYDALVGVLIVRYRTCNYMISCGRTTDVLRLGSPDNDFVRQYAFCAKPQDGRGGVVAMVINLQNSGQQVFFQVDGEELTSCSKRCVL